jgi:hypothetical protein
MIFMKTEEKNAMRKILTGNRQLLCEMNRNLLLNITREKGNYPSSRGS